MLWYWVVVSGVGIQEAEPCQGSSYHWEHVFEGDGIVQFLISHSPALSEWLCHASPVMMGFLATNAAGPVGYRLKLDNYEPK